MFVSVYLFMAWAVNYVSGNKQSEKKLDNIDFYEFSISEIERSIEERMSSSDDETRAFRSVNPTNEYSP